MGLVTKMQISNGTNNKPCLASKFCDGLIKVQNEISFKTLNLQIKLLQQT